MKKPIKLLLFSMLILLGCQQGLQLFPAAAPSGYLRMFGGSANDEGKTIIYQSEIDAYTLLGSYGTEAFAGVQTIAGSDMYLVQVDRNGDKKWEITINESQKQLVGKDLLAKSDRSWLALGTASPTGNDLGGNRKMIIAEVKLDDTGNPLIDSRYWFGNDQYDLTAAAIEKDPNGGYLILGNTTRPTLNHTPVQIDPNFSEFFDIVLIKLDANLDVVWERQYGYEGHEFPTHVRAIPGGGYIVVAGSDGVNFDIQTMILRLDQDGNALQVRKIGNGSFSYPYDLQLDDTHLYIARGGINADNARTALVEQYTLAGLERIWQKPLTHEGDVFMLGPESLALLPDGGFIVSATVQRFYEEENEFSQDIMLYRMDATGENAAPGTWPQYFGDLPADIAGRVIPQLQTGQLQGFLMVCSLGFGPSTMMGLIRTDVNGQLDPQ